MGPAHAPVGRLVICPTPIGNLKDVTLRVLETLADADVVACEDTRHTRILLKRHGLAVKLVSLHEHNERARTPALVAQMADGATVALVSDAGTPLISDPGFALLRATLEAGIALEVLPGPSAVTTALVASGLSAERWCFVGFLPRKRAELEELLEHATETLVAFESPRRVPATLELLAAREPDRPVTVCRELTKLHEEIRRGSAADLASHYGVHGSDAGVHGSDAGGHGSDAQTVRGEVVLVLGAATAHQQGLQQALQALGELVAAGARARPAAAVVAKLTGVGANELYRGLLSRGQ